MLNYWAVMYEEPRPAALAQLMDHLKSLEEHLKKRLDGETPSPIAVDSVMGEGHQRLHELDAAHSKTMVDLKHHIEEGDGAQADHSSLRMEQQGATEKARALDEKVRALKEKTRAFEEEARAALGTLRRLQEMAWRLPLELCCSVGHNGRSGALPGPCCSIGQQEGFCRGCVMVLTDRRNEAPPGPCYSIGQREGWSMSGPCYGIGQRVDVELHWGRVAALANK